mmetsp:Transcript_54978/g.176326  ORF Transcript_54978/g.176326 Transcript_54978/m.176326 type:complete len:80 (-) Transcript_54978:372-611(-)
MPSAQCDKCQRWLDEVAHDDSCKDRLRGIIGQRAKRMFGQIVNISPGIRHNEVDEAHACDGVLWYKPFASTPAGVSWSG